MGTSAEVTNGINSKVGLRWRRADQVQKVFFQEKIQLVHNSTVGAEKGGGFPKIQKLRRNYYETTGIYTRVAMIDHTKLLYLKFPKEERFSKKEITQESVGTIDKQSEQ